MKAKGFTHRKVERLKSMINHLSICDKNVSKKIAELYAEIKTLEYKKKRMTKYKVRLDKSLEKLQPRLVCEKDEERIERIKMNKSNTSSLNLLPF